MTFFVPKVVGAVFVGHDGDGDFGIRFNGVYAKGGISEVLLHIGPEALQCRFPGPSCQWCPVICSIHWERLGRCLHQISLSTFKDVTLHSAGFLL